MKTAESPEEKKQHVRELYSRLLLRDRPRYANRFRNLARMEDEELDSFAKQLENAAAHSLHRFADALHCELNPDLPITPRAPQIAEAMRGHPVVIVCGSTGSGKTTQLPKIALSLGLGRVGRIGCTQPRRIAASALARRLAAETQCECGTEVGYKVRFDDRTARNTVIKFMTDGILLAETRSDPELLEYDCIILDEVHERSLNIDFLLGYVRRLLSCRKDLKVVISSATLDAARISEFFSNAPVVEVEGRMFPVEDYYLEPGEDEELTESVARGVEFLSDLDNRGDILVFLPGEREIRDCTEVLDGRRLLHTELLPLFGRLSAADQQKVFHPGPRRRIILATNVAETSLTIPGIRFVIDSGQVRLSRYNPRTRIQELRIEPVSKASARQRRGRCGRVRDGVCVHLYSEEAFNEFSEFTPPEIQRSSLAGVLLQMAALRLGSIEQFPLIDPPSPQLIREGRQMLEDLLALDEHGQLTRAGWKMAEIPLDPHLAKMLMSAEHHKVLPEIVAIAAYLSIPDPRERPFDSADAADRAHRAFFCADSDFIGILILHDAIEKLLKDRTSNQALRNFSRKNFMNYRRLREWRNLMDDLREICDENHWSCARTIDMERLGADAVHKALMSALPRQLGCFDSEVKLYSDMQGKKFSLFPGSALSKMKKPPQWVLFFALVETSRVFARTNAVVQPQWLEAVAPHLCSKSYDLIHWDSDSGFVYAREKVTAGQLLIHPGRRCHYAKIRPDEARSVFIREGLAAGLVRLPGSWVDGFNDLFNSLRAMETKMRRPDAILDTQAVYAHFEEVLPRNVHSVNALKEDFLRNRKDYSPEPDNIVLVPFDELHETDYPDFLTCSGIRFPLRYVFEPGEENDGVTMEVKQEFLNLLNPFLPEYLVPGYLEEKVGFLLRSLSKTLRKKYMPLEEVQQAFMEEYRDGGIFTGRSLAESLSDFLEQYRGEAPEPDVFEEIELPEYLTMKLAVVDERGRAKIHRSFPEESLKDSRLSHALPTVRKFHAAAPDSWPGDEELPLTLPLSAKNPVRAYPALTDEGETIGRELFLEESEARAHHAKAVLKLWRLRLPQILKPVKNSFKPGHAMELEFFLHYPDWRDDILDNAATEALGGDLWSLRNRAEFELRTEESRDTVADCARKWFDELERIHPLLMEVKKANGRLHPDSETRLDADVELSLLFRPGFLRTGELFLRTERYLKALLIRLRRAFDAPGKDLSKGEPLEQFVRKFRMAEEMMKGVENSPGLLAYLLLLEEARIAVYAPEMKPLVKCSEAVLEREWETLRLS